METQMLNGCWIEAESTVKILCMGLVPDLQRIAGVKAAKDIKLIATNTIQQDRLEDF